MTEALLPNGTITTLADWGPNTGTLANSNLRVDEGSASPNDADYVRNVEGASVNGDIIEWSLTNPTSGFDTSVFWNLKVRAKENTSETGNLLVAYVLQGSSIITSIDLTSSLTTSYQTFTHSFSASGVTDANDLRIRLRGYAKVTSPPDAAPYVSMVELVIQADPSRPPTLILNIPGDLASREVHPTLSNYFAFSWTTAAAVSGLLANLSSTPLDANARQNAGVALSEYAFQAYMDSNLRPSAIEYLNDYLDIITPSVFVDQNPEWAAIGPSLAYDLLKDFMSQADINTFQTWASGVVDSWWPILITEPFALNPTTATSRYANWSPLFIGGFASLIIASEITRTHYLSVAASSFTDFFTYGFGASGDPFETYHYQTFGLASGVWYSAHLRPASGWASYLDYLYFASLPWARKHGMKMVADGDTTYAEPGLPDFFYWAGGNVENLFRMSLVANPVRPMVACLYASTSSGTPVTTSGASSLVTKVYPHSLKVIVRRNTSAEEDWYFQAHVGAENGAGHDHGDRGQLLLATHGWYWFHDPGGFGNPAAKYGIDHNVVTVAGSGPAFNPEAGSITSVTDNATATIIRLDVATAYSPDLVRGFRNVAVVKKNAPYLIVYDDYERDGSSTTYKAQFILPAALEFSSNAIRPKINDTTGKKLLYPGTSPADLNVTAGQIYAIGNLRYTDPSNWLFNVTYDNDATQTPNLYDGDHAGLSSHVTLDQNINQIKKLVPIGRPVALAASGVSTPSGWTEITKDVSPTCRIYSLGNGTIGSETRTFNDISCTVLTVASTGVNSNLRYMLFPSLPADDVPTITNSATGSLIEWPDGSYELVKFSSDGIEFLLQEPAVDVTINASTATASAISYLADISLEQDVEFSSSTATATAITYLGTIQLTTSISEGAVENQRYLPMEWAPRWMNCYYDDSSLLKKLYFLGIVSPNDKLRSLTAGRIVPGFNNYLSEPRIGFYAQYIFPADHIPDIVSFYSAVSSGSLVEKYSVGDLLYELTAPVYYKDSQGTLIFRNLDVVSVSATTASGYIDLTSYLTAHPLLPDSGIIIENAFGDQMLFEPDDSRFQNNHLNVTLTGTYTVRWHSQTLYDGFISGENYVTIEGEKIRLYPYNFSNTWDEYSKYVGIHRRSYEDNRSLKGRCQHLSLSVTEVQGISSALGNSGVIVWNTQLDSTLALPNNPTSITFLNQPTAEYIKEDNPLKDGDNIRLLFVPTELISIFVGSQYVQPSSYLVSGSLIMPLDHVLQNTKAEYITAHYKTEHITNTLTASGTLVDITRENDGRELLRVLYSTGVLTQRNSRKVSTWKWDRDQGLITGLAQFDFD